MNAHIIDALKKNKLILFIGSGFSKPLGFPDWNGLITKILSEISREETKYQVLIDGLASNMFSSLEVLDKIKDKKKDIYSVLDKEIDRPLNNMNLELHKKVGRVSSKIITTNYDRLLEEATKYKKIVFDNTYHIANISEIDNFILKLHGCIESPDKCILFQDDYEELYSETPAIEKLRSLISDHTILFIGFSLSDEYVRKQFDYIYNIYKGYTKNHYLLTTDKNTNFDGVSSIVIDSWSEIEVFFDQLIEAKENILQTSAAIEVINEGGNITDIKEKTYPLEMKFALLISAPIDREDRYTFEEVLKYFAKYNVIVDCFHLSIDTLHNIEDYDYILVFTNIIKNKLLIEDQYLKSKLISLQEFEGNLMIEKLKGLFIFVDKEPSLDSENITLPITLLLLNELNSFVFKIFQKKSLNLLNEKSQIINIDLFNLTSLTKGNSKIKMLSEEGKVKLSQNIDAKNLINFIGRKTDLEDIIRKIIDTTKQILTIKGSGGIGKTSIVKKVALELYARGYFNDGINFIDCESIKNYQSFEYKLAQCFDLDSSLNLKDHISDNNMRKNALIILDNFEPLLYIEDNDLIKNLITFICDYSNVVITSREWIGFEFEEGHELRAFTNEEAFQLFTKYYKSAISEFDTKILKEEILDKLLNNNPLAIKLITKNIPKTKSMTQLKNELETNFFTITEAGYNDIFDGKVDANIERSKSLYQSIAYSFNKLLPNEKLLFEILSLFPDGIHMNNIRAFFSQGEYKWDSKKVTDKEITALENKSLIEINKGFIELQSILGRFAGHEFLKRSDKEKIDYYQRAFNLNAYLIEMLRSRKEGMDSWHLQVFDQNIGNNLKCLDYLFEFEGDKRKKLDYIDSIDIYFNITEQAEEFHKKLEKIKHNFSDIENAELYLSCLIINSRYYAGDFENAYIELSKLLPIEKLYSLDINVPLEKKIMSTAMNVYNYSNYGEIRKLIISKGYDYPEFLFAMLFHAGEYTKSLDLKITEGEFYLFEIQYNTNSIDKDRLEEYIGSLYKKRYAEIMQTNYIKAKLGEIDKKTVDKLVVTNPYTQGLKSLMYAFLENDTASARSFYLNAIKNLEHIKYYYIEAIYYYSKFLLSLEIGEGNEWLRKGKELARINHYRVLIHKFDCLILGIDENYDEEKYVLPNDLIIDELLAINKQ
ncbi:SIR2 family protein [Paenibacillus dokdonensis]|uniref:SIR2 family protein n=1 Tax=Paenibacillus dokdonensis TaxID=2567944 RepID=UPI0010A82D6C|nr:SIR2 family protein [Paenibacillus dokdonensis]